MRGSAPQRPNAPRNERISFLGLLHHLYFELSSLLLFVIFTGWFHSIWVGSYGSLKSKTNTKVIDKGFGSQQTIARVPFETNKSYYPEDLGHYYLPPEKKGTYFHKLEPVLDIKNDRFQLRAKNSGDKKYISKYITIVR